MSGKSAIVVPAAVRDKGLSLDGLSAEDLTEAKRRFSIIKPLVRCDRRTDADGPPGCRAGLPDRPAAGQSVRADGYSPLAGVAGISRVHRPVRPGTGTAEG